MPFLNWSDKFDLGIPSINEQHKKLVGMLNELFDGMQAAKGRETVGRVLDELIDYTVEHFRYEESLFDKTGYIEARAHKAEHAALAKKVLDIQTRYKGSTTVSISLEVLNFLKEWLNHHIQETDRKYAPFLISKGIH